MEQAVLGRVDQTTLRDSVYAELHRAFTLGAFAPGDGISLRFLADRLGTSMTPIREAVRRLVAEGALHDTPSRTLEVPRLDRPRVRDLMRARIALETLLTESAVERMDGDTEATLKAILDEARDPSQEGPAPDLWQNYRFHFTLYRRSESPVLLPMVESLWLQYGPCLNVIVRRADPAIGRGNEYHRDILAAVVARDVEAAKAAVVADIERSFGFLQLELEERAG